MRKWTAVAYAAGVALLAAGCGAGSDNSFADQSAKDITQAASADMKALQSLRISGDISTGGQKVDIDMQSTTDGDCQGTVKVGGGTAQIVSSGGSYWMKPDDAFWEQTAGSRASVIEKAIGDKWVTVPSNSGLDEVCHLDNFLKAFDTSDNPSATPSNAGSERVDGQDAVKITGEEKGQQVSAWVATGDKHYILKLEVGSPGDSDSGALAFSDFDEPVDVTTPAPSEVADLSSLGG